MTLFRVLETPLDATQAIAAVSAPDAGGIDLFLGVVRDHNDGRAVTRLEYHAYVSMAEKEMQRIADEIAAEIPGVRLSALHRIGSLSVGDLAVVCAASAPHRAEAFAACRALIDRIKHRVPVWKREHGPDGPYWVGWEDARCGHGEAGDSGHAHAHDQEQ
jgi:molybdopterin synthase catalytic subunit